MNDRLAESRPDQQTFGDTFFTIDPAFALPVIGLFIVAGLAVAGIVLGRQRVRS